MRAVGAFEAKTHLSELLAAVEKGESIVITRHGRPVARLVPEPATHERGAAIARIKSLRARVAGGITLDDILSARDEGAPLTLVVDASLIAGLLLPDEEGIDPRILETEHLVAPWLLWAELRNILVTSERRGRLVPGIAEQMIEAVDALGIELDSRPSGTSVMQLARRHRLTVYDTLYLELAMRLSAQLGTHDAALRKAAHTENVALLK